MTSLIYFALAFIFGVAHHFWACELRFRIAKYAADHVPRLSPDWANHIQNWFIRVSLPLVIVLKQGNTPELLGFRLPSITTEILSLLTLLTATMFLWFMVAMWFAVSVAKDAEVIRNIKNWPKKLSWQESLVGPLLWTIPEECFLRG